MGLHANRLILLWVLILFVLYATLSIIRHNHFESGGFDLGIFDQAVWQYAHFQTPYNTIKERFILGDHLTLTLPLLAPLFWIWDDVRMLLMLQAFWISFSTFAIYKLVILRKFSLLAALCLSVTYSLFYGIQYAVFFDFHSVIIGVGLLPWVAYFLESGKKKLLLIAIVLLLLTQENMGFALASLSFLYLFQPRYRRFALVSIFFGLVFSLIASKLVAAFSPVGFEYWPELTLNPITNLTRLFDHVEKRQVWFYAFSWFSFLPLLSPGAILGVVFDLAQYFVTGDRFYPMWTAFKHHRAILAPLLLIGTLDTLVLLKKHKISPQLISLIILVVAFAQQYLFHFPLNKITKPIYWQEEPWMEDNRQLLKTIPADARVATQQSLVPHLSHRKDIYLAWPRIHDFATNVCGQKSCWWLDFGGKPEYLVVDLHPNQWLTQLLETNENFASAVGNMEHAGKISLVNEVNKAKLYKVFE